MALRGKSPKLAKPTKPQIVVFGPPGVGKTWTSLDFPNAYYVDCEGGANLPHYTAKLEQVGAQYLGPEDGACDFDTVIDEVRQLATTQHDRKTLIIDSFSKLFQTCVQTEYDRLIATGKKAEFGLDKKPAVSQTRRLIRWLSSLDMNVLIICHERGEWSQGEQIGLTFDAWDKLAYELHLVLQVFRTGKSRRARVVKSRYDTWPEAETVDWSYETFATRFGRAILESDHVAVPVATEEQVKKIERLVSILKIGQEEKQKVWDSAGVSDWSQMPRERLQSAIDKLEARMEG